MAKNNYFVGRLVSLLTQRSLLCDVQNV